MILRTNERKVTNLCFHKNREIFSHIYFFFRLGKSRKGNNHDTNIVTEDDGENSSKRKGIFVSIHPGSFIGGEIQKLFLLMFSRKICCNEIF